MNEFGGNPKGLELAGRKKRIPLSVLVEKSLPDLDGKTAYSAILCGEIFVDGDRIRDPKATFPTDATILRQIGKYVGRGGVKLEGALEDLGVNPEGLICLDAGASTGGFTDCLLFHGAAVVHSVDVGYNQLAWKLRSDSRVIVRERTNIMTLERSDLDPPPQMAVVDLSFRSLRGAASKLLLLTGGGIVLALVKPQFENPDEDGFDGIVRTREARSSVLESLRRDLPAEGVHVRDAAASRISGRKGNAEIFLLLAASPAEDASYVEKRILEALDFIDHR